MKMAWKLKHPAFLVVTLLLAAAPISSYADVILKPEEAQGILIDIARYRKESKEGGTEEKKLEALFGIGVRVQELLDLMNRDIKNHGLGTPDGYSNPFAELVVKRLQEYGIRVTLVEKQYYGLPLYTYDFAAFHEYLKLAPRGKRAADIRFQMLLYTFDWTMGSDPAELRNTDLAGLLQTVAEEEKFLKDYPTYPEIEKVRFFLTVDYYRLYKHSPDGKKAKEYKKLTLQALEELKRKHPDSPEAWLADTKIRPSLH